MAKIVKSITERERDSWADLVRRVEFAAELAGAKADRILLKDAFNKLNDAISKYKPLFRQRVAAELSK